MFGAGTFDADPHVNNVCDSHGCRGAVRSEYPLPAIDAMPGAPRSTHRATIGSYTYWDAPPFGSMPANK